MRLCGEVFRACYHGGCRRCGKIDSDSYRSGLPGHYELPSTLGMFIDKCFSPDISDHRCRTLECSQSAE